jgi:hypothetical protein
MVKRSLDQRKLRGISEGYGVNVVLIIAGRGRANLPRFAPCGATRMRSAEGSKMSNQTTSSPVVLPIAAYADVASRRQP